MKKVQRVIRWPALFGAGILATAVLTCGVTESARASTNPPSPASVSPTATPASAADDPAVTPNIVGGTEATIADAPWQVALVRPAPTYPTEFDGQFCGGSIIAAQWIVTAAHCVVSGSSVSAASSIKVLAGQATLSTTSNTRPVAVSNIYVHPAYVSSADHDDVALLKLVAPLALVPGSVQAIGLPTAAPVTGATELITGWGDRASGAGNYPLTMRKAQVSVFGDSTCSAVYGSSYSAAKMVCAANNTFTIDTCQGDSGGPLAHFDGASWALDGITSFGQGCAQAPFPGVYTEVFTYKTWINGYVSPPPSTFTTTPTPTVRGSAIVGQTLTARTGTWSPTPDSFSYQWAVGGTPVGGALGSGPTYPVQTVDAGLTITVTVTAKKAGYTDAPKTSAPTATVTRPFVTVPVPTIGGTKKVGKTLTAQTGTWSPTPTSYSYQWSSSATSNANFTPISGANGKTYMLKTADKNRFLRVTVTAIKSGYAPTPSTSASTVAIG